MKKGKMTAVVAVRKGSQRIPNKNITPFGDSNLLEMKLSMLKKVNNIDEIISMMETKIIIKLKIKEKTDTTSKKHRTNTLIYKKSIKIITKTENNESFKYKFIDFLGKMHNLLRGAGVTGDQALDDILHCLFLCYIEDKISEEGAFDLANSTKACYNGTVQRKVKEYVKYLKVSLVFVFLNIGFENIFFPNPLLSKKNFFSSVFKTLGFFFLRK